MKEEDLKAEFDAIGEEEDKKHFENFQFC